MNHLGIGIGDLLVNLAERTGVFVAREMIRRYLPSVNKQIEAMEKTTKRQKKEVKQRRADKRRKDVWRLPGGVEYFPPTKKGSPRK